MLADKVQFLYLADSSMGVYFIMNLLAGVAQWTERLTAN